MYAHVHHRFTILKRGVRGYTSHGHVILMEGNYSTMRSIGLQWLIVYSSFSWLASSSLPDVSGLGKQWLQKVCISKNLGRERAIDNKLSLLKNDKKSTTCINNCLMRNYVDACSAQSDFYFHKSNLRLRL